MNRLEMRIDRYSFDTERDYDRFDSFSIGHESCAVKFFHIIQQANLLEFLKEQSAKGKEIRILTPFVPQSHISKMKSVLRDLFCDPMFKDSMVTVNDLGMMQYIHALEHNREICLGREMVFSFDFTPWGQLIYKNETENVQHIIKQVNFYDDIKMSFFKRFNVTSIESNLTSGTMESLMKIQNNGFRVYINDSFFLYGIQRSCYVRRQTPNGKCNQKICDQMKRISLSAQWEESGYYKNDAAAFFPSELFLRGNQICGRARSGEAYKFGYVIFQEL